MRFSSKSSVGGDMQTQSNATKNVRGKVALVNQQSPFTTILNNDLTDDDFDFAFTIQGKKDGNRFGSTKNATNEFNLA